jgi:hypothetical protein
LTTFFRLLIAIPWYIVGIFYGIGAFVSVIVAWFAIVVTGRYPDGLHNFVASSLRYFTRLNAFSYLLVDPLPPFDGSPHDEYPVRVPVAPAPVPYNRLLTLVRIILMIPVYVIVYVLGLALGVLGLVSWIVIVVLGRQPRGLFDMLKFVLAYTTRGYAYMMLLTETYPPFSPEA